MIDSGKVQLYEDARDHMYVVQPLPLVEIYRLSAIIGLSQSQGLGEKGLVERAFIIADEAMRQRRKHGNGASE